MDTRRNNERDIKIMNLNELDVRIWDQIVDPAFVQEYVYELNHPTRKWQFSGAGVPKDASIWFRELGECERTTRLYNEYIEPRLLADIKNYDMLRVDRVYANAQTSDNRSDIHVDAHFENCYSVMFYATVHWPKEFDGETIFYTDDDEIYSAILPKPGRVVLFNGKMPHIGRPPNPILNGRRMTVVWKLVPKEDVEKWIPVENNWNIY